LLLVSKNGAGYGLVAYLFQPRANLFPMKNKTKLIERVADRLMTNAENDADRIIAPVFDPVISFVMEQELDAKNDGGETAYILLQRCRKLCKEQLAQYHFNERLQDLIRKQTQDLQNEKETTTPNGGPSGTDNQRPGVEG
jgi:hypothetical protein